MSKIFYLGWSMGWVALFLGLSGLLAMFLAGFALEFRRTEYVHRLVLRAWRTAGWLFVSSALVLVLFVEPWETTPLSDVDFGFAGAHRWGNWVIIGIFYLIGGGQIYLTATVLAIIGAILILMTRTDRVLS